MRTLPSMLILVGALATPVTGQSDTKASKTPPEGPPWTTDFLEARALALESGKPIFLYSTKTY